jgi:hypothetical protein
MLYKMDRSQGSFIRIAKDSHLEIVCSSDVHRQYSSERGVCSAACLLHSPPMVSKYHCIVPLHRRDVASSKGVAWLRQELCISTSD